MPDGSVLIDGMALIEEVNEHLGLNLQDRNYERLRLHAGQAGENTSCSRVVDGDGVR